MTFEDEAIQDYKKFAAVMVDASNAGDIIEEVVEHRMAALDDLITLLMGRIKFLGDDDFINLVMEECLKLEKDKDV
jgi:hypothetical protein